MAGRPKGSSDISPRIRGAFIRGLLIHEKKTGKGLSELFADAIEKQGILTVTDSIAKYVPKEMDITTTNLTPEQWLEEMSDASKPESTGPADTIPRPIH